MATGEKPATTTTTATTATTTSGTSRSNTASQSSYTIDLRKLDQWLEMRIIDIEFLYGYYEPTLFILCESSMTWVGRYSFCETNRKC